jgi:methylated-DNA-[protein]-cysteine S-methyltransferase
MSEPYEDPDAPYEDHDLAAIGDAVRRTAAEVAPAPWRRTRDELARRAAAAGLVDVAFQRHDSPLGAIMVAATAEGVVRIGLPAEEEDEVVDELARRVSARVLSSGRESLSDLRRQLDEYFDGRRRKFDVVLDWRLTTDFRRDVLRATARIPYGGTASYKELAGRAGSPAAVRAAGSALATNPLPIVVPCHRVLRSGGALGAYRGGVEAKAWLLDLEGAT